MINKYIVELCLVLLYAKFLSGASIKMTHGKINVDEFLTKVMDSEKFDEIAEKIADKAVEKFQKLQNITLVPVDSGHFKEDATYRVSEVETKDPNDYEIDDSEVEVIPTQRNVIGKIDTNAFKLKELEELKDLSLKYKQFTKGPNLKTSEENPREDVPKTSDIHEDYTLEQEENKHIDQAAVDSNVNDQTKKIKETQTDHSSKVIKSKHKNIFKSNESQDYDSKDDSKDDIQNEKEKSIPASDQKDDTEMLPPKSIRLKARNGESEEINDDKDFETHSLNKNNVKHEDKNDDKYLKRRPAYEYLHLPVTNKDGENLKNTSGIYEDTPLTLRFKDKISKLQGKERLKVTNDVTRTDRSTVVHNSSDPNVIPVREEGNKLYTYEKNPDYEDYHNEITRIQNQLKKIN